MSSCPRNEFNQPVCYITSHPEHPYEKFCATCKKQFIERDSFQFGEFFIIVLATIGMILIL
ncbi:MAG: hypothetical protein SWJ54_13485 [Cyanobacteriota bacterium]|nr:hypothetical protein [Cyanobacteriota bacterium]